jgi:hypothetical protein
VHSGQGCDIAIQGRAPNNFLILSAESKSVLKLICNRFASELNRWFGPSQGIAFASILPGSPRKSPSCNRVPACSLLNTIFQIQINKNAWEKFFTHERELRTFISYYRAPMEINKSEKPIQIVREVI